MTNNQTETSLTPSKWFSQSQTFCFKVPVYQRLFTWGEAQFDRLLDDLTDHFGKNSDPNSDPYYLGIITVVNRKGERILIDGQQRLTVITILTAMLRNANDVFPDNIRDYIDYEARPDDRESLTKIWGNGSKWIEKEKSEEELQDTLAAEKISSRSMCEFIMHIKRNSDKWCRLWENVKNRLTLLVSILPKEYTEDFKLQNEYFEKMNSAGKQLEPHEILKVRICQSELDFNNWNAIEDFSARYNDADKTNGVELICMRNAILEDVGEKIERKMSLEKWRPSLIDFPMFLLHVLNISKDGKCSIPSDSHRLLEHFNNNNNPPVDNNFLKKMIEYRKFLDHWVIHREVDSVVDDDGADDSRFRFWTDDNKESAYVKEDKENELLRKKFKQIQIALYALEGEKQEWLRTVYLAYVKTDNNPTKLEHLYAVLRDYLIEKSSFGVKEDERWKINSRLDSEEWPDDYLTYGEHMRAAFICLDYFLWLLANDDDDATLKLKEEVFGKDGPGEVITRFIPRANRSIEHFHPQTDNSSQNRGEKADNDTTKDGWGALIKLDGSERSVKHIFGNLALISAGRNSEYSNMPVGGKSDLIVRSVEKKSIESIKLLLMKNACRGQDKEWLPETARAHAKLMKKVVLWGLGKAGYISDTALSSQCTKCPSETCV